MTYPACTLRLMNIAMVVTIPTTIMTDSVIIPARYPEQTFLSAGMPSVDVPGVPLTYSAFLLSIF